MRTRTLVTILSLSCAITNTLTACSSDDALPTGESADASVDATATSDAASTMDAGSEDAQQPDVDADADTGTTDAEPPSAVSGSLEVKAVGSLPTTAAIGTVTLVGGGAQWRPRPAGGGVLSVSLVEQGADARTFEVTVYDGDDVPTAGETFGAAGGATAPANAARVETYGPTIKSWRSSGDGQVVVKAFSETSVTLTLVGVGQFIQPSGSGDTFALEGTVTVPIVALKPATGGVIALTVSNLGPEPIGGAPLNLSDPSKVPSATPSLTEEEFPYVGKLLAMRSNDTVGSAARRLLLSFPSGHLPHIGQTIPLNTFDRAVLSLVEGPTFKGDPGEKYWEADQGMLTVEGRTTTTISIKVQGARMQSESPAAKGIFTLDGTLTFALP